MAWSRIALPLLPGSLYPLGGVAAAAFKPNKLHAFVRASDLQIHQNSTTDGINWGNWTPIPGGFTTPSLESEEAAPSATVFQEKLFVFARRGDNRICYNSTSDGTTWGTWEESRPQGATLSGPRAAVFRENTLYVFVRGTDNGIHFLSTSDGTTWFGWKEVEGGGRTGDAPGVSAYPAADRLDLFVKGFGLNIHMNYSVDGTAFSQVWAPMGSAQTASGPCAAVLGAREYVFIRGADNKIYSIQTDGHTWQHWKPAGEQFPETTDGPGVAVFDNRLHVFIHAKGSRQLLSVSGQED